jgi:hypothetical protein
MSLGLATVVIGCLMLLTVVGVIVKLIPGQHRQGRYMPLLLGSAGPECTNLSALSQGHWQKVVPR